MSLLKVVKASSLMVLLAGTIACSPSAEETVKETAVSFQLGKDYEVVRKTPSKSPQIIEHFSLYCDHCYSTEPLIKSLKSSLAKDVAFKRSHVLFLPSQRPDWGKTMTFGVAAAQKLGVEEVFVATVFDSHFVQEKFLGEYAQLRDIFGTLGVDAQTFKNTMNSEETVDVVRAMANKASDDKVRFTPDFIVNDKYRVLLSNVPKAAKENGMTTEKQLDKLVAFLLTNP
ncbi:thiol:disulfide interchange protein DsbA/DsbL [Psychrobium sp. nBUS_13]|uniref:thiol:disulfide interchange protein DsbA/DsbL n=1 Tax=Psychrobium sp. nBUS_13 TaxID=3395319 RepID=UPI003EB87627